MTRVCIEVRCKTDLATKNLIKYLRKLCKLKLVNAPKNADNDTVICTVSMEKNDTLENIIDNNKFMIDLSNVLADYITSKYEPKLITKLVNDNYKFYSSKERKEILEYAINKSSSTLEPLAELAHNRRKNIIIRSLLDYFKSENVIIFTGFVDFRLKNYVAELKEFLSKLVDEFFIDKEYQEFIKLLKYFVESQESKYGLIHLLVDYNGDYVLLDEELQRVANNYVKESVFKSVGTIDNVDLLISTLVTIAPKRIIIHGLEQFSDKNIINTIENIFVGRTLLCNQCSLCTTQVFNKN